MKAALAVRLGSGSCALGLTTSTSPDPRMSSENCPDHLKDLCPLRVPLVILAVIGIPEHEVQMISPTLRFTTVPIP